MYDGYFTHLPLLMAMVAKTDGNIIELGCGYYSTYVLHTVCKVLGRKLISIENDREWINKFMHLASDLHHFEYISDWNEYNPGDQKFSLAFVDHHPGDRRYQEILKLKDKCQFIVIHDTQPGMHDYRGVLETFKYQFQYTELNPATSVVSEFNECKL